VATYQAFDVVAGGFLAGRSSSIAQLVVRSIFAFAPKGSNVFYRQNSF
jgi:hypothetical protein